MLRRAFAAYSDTYRLDLRSSGAKVPRSKGVRVLHHFSWAFADDVPSGDGIGTRGYRNDPFDGLFADDYRQPFTTEIGDDPLNLVDDRRREPS